MLSPNTLDWLNCYQSNDELPNTDPKSELAKYVPTTPIILFRGLKNNINIDAKIHVQTKISSWSKDLKVAINFANDGVNGIVMKATFQPNDILVDTTLLDARDYNHYEKEVITLPGNYPIQIIWFAT